MVMRKIPALRRNLDDVQKRKFEEKERKTIHSQDAGQRGVIGVQD